MTKDSLHLFIEEYINRTENKKDKINKGMFYEAYVTWWLSRNMDAPPPSRHEVSHAMTQMGFTGKNAYLDGVTQICWIGVQWEAR